MTKMSDNSNGNIISYVLDTTGNLKPIFAGGGIKRKVLIVTNKDGSVDKESVVYKQISRMGGGLDIADNANLYLFDYLLMCNYSTSLFYTWKDELRKILITLGCNVTPGDWEWLYRSDGLICRNKETGQILPY